MGQTETTRQSDEILPPVVGSIVNVAVTNAVQVVDFTTFPQTAVLPTTTLKGSEDLNPLGQYVTMVASADVFAAFAGTAAALASITAASTSTISAAGVITPNNNNTVRIVAGVPFHFRMPPGPSQAGSSSLGTGSPASHGGNSPARFGGFITSSTATLCIWVSSR